LATECWLGSEQADPGLEQKLAEAQQQHQVLAELAGWLAQLAEQSVPKKA
jgi:hypothetical protein